MTNDPKIFKQVLFVASFFCMVISTVSIPAFIYMAVTGSVLTWAPKVFILGIVSGAMYFLLLPEISEYVNRIKDDDEPK